MARKEAGTILQEELTPAAGAESRLEFDRPEPRATARSSSRANSRSDSAREEIDDARLVDLDVAEESPFLRGQKRVSARRSALPRKTASRLLWAGIAVAILCVAAIAAAGLYQYGERSWRFRVDSSDSIEIAGTQNVTKAQIMEVMGADIGRNIFFIPLAQQKVQLEQIPWVESASVMRFVPNRLRVEIHERTPVAFARVGSHICLIDAIGTLMDLPKSAQQHNRKYDFPVVLGMNPGEPLSTRTPRMKAYNDLIRDLDSSGAHYSQDLSEVDVSDLDDLKVRVNDPKGDVLLELGSADYLNRYKTYVTHVQEWRQQFQKLESVNLRYENQVIVNPDLEGRPKEAVLTPAAMKAAAAAGVRPAALITKDVTAPKMLPKPAFELSKATLDSASGKKPAAKAKPKKSPAVRGKARAPKQVAKASPAHAAPQKKSTQTAQAATSGIPKPSAATPKASAGAN
jgi:cell division protein FtsQ